MATKKKNKNQFSIGSFFVLNVEKMIFALAIPAALYIAYLGMQYEGLQWQPSELVQDSDKADKFIKSNVRKAADEGVSIFTYDTYANWIKTDIKPDLYQTETMWLPSLFPEKNKRGDVRASLFPVQDLRASSGLGAITISSNSPLAQERLASQGQGAGAAVSTTSSSGMGGNSGAGRIGERWAIVTGLIPIKRQLDVYVNMFSSSVMPDPMRDTPAYYLYEVQRAEVQPGQSELQWQKLDFLTGWQKRTILWSSFGVDPVDPSYLAPVYAFPMAFPLPPVAKRYTESVVHTPVIPMLTDSQVQELKDAEKVQKKLFEEMLKVNQEDLLEGGPFGGAMPSGMGAGGSMGGSMGGAMGSSMGTGGSMGGSPNMGSAMPMGDSAGMNTGSRRQRQIAQELEEEFKPITITDFLFRFLDFDVLPGKTYRYRVKLILANPNYNFPLTYLENDTLAKEDYLETDWSEPSNMVTIPLESRVLVSDVTAPNARVPWDDPTAKIMAVYFDLNDGSEWYAEKDRITRGTICNFTKTEVQNPLLAQTGMNNDMMGGLSGSPSPSGRQPGRTRTQSGRTPSSTSPATAAKKEDKKTIDVVSDVCVLDMAGGQSLYKTNSPNTRDVLDLKSPSKVIVLEPSGNIVIHSLTTDLAEIEQIKNPVSQTGMGGMGGGSMGRGMGGY